MNKIISRELKDSPPPFNSALLLVRHEDVALLDRRALRDAGIRNIRVMTEGIQAAKLLADSSLKANKIGEPDVILCHEKLADISGEEFVRLIRLHPLLEEFPVVVTLDTNTKSALEKVLDYSDACLPRPYTVMDLLNQLNKVVPYDRNNITRNLETTAFDTAIQYFTRQTLLRTQNAEQNYRDGLNLVRLHQWDEAISILNYAVRQNAAHGDAYLALAAAWRGKGNVDKCMQMLHESLTAFITSNAFERAKNVSEKIIKQNPGISPLYAEAKRRIVAAEFELAARTIQVRQPVNLEETRDLYEQIAKGCLAAANPEEAIVSLSKHLVEQELGMLGSSLETYTRQRLYGGKSGLDKPGVQPAPLQSVWTQQHKERTTTKPDHNLFRDDSPPVIAFLQEPVPSESLKNYPMLRDALTVAKVTLGLFKSKKKR